MYSNLNNGELKEKEQDFYDAILNLYESPNFKSPNDRLEDSYEGLRFLELLKSYDFNALPYHTLTMLVYTPENNEIEYFADSIHKAISESDYDLELKKKTLKIRLHLLLAEQQKQSLYTKQDEKIKAMDEETKKLKETINHIEDVAKKVEKTSESTEKKYNDIISQYISILGIFAAILMTAFGGIQAFSSIYKDNSFNLEDSLMIACIGFMGILLLIFILLNGIAKLTGKSIDSSEGRWFNRHPTLINSFIILSTIIAFILVLKIVKIPSVLINNSWLWVVPILYPVVMFCIFNKKST
ncbi:hypothetical protein [Staphylococcus xylosus]|uniref:hypothetical protein n=1 Tax=Staphylococcus xylosus TaxID=1288 RepID=UPI00194E5F12|nr:hypothetical protein [Staphylococcus xylosus]MBM6637300.1 hypothetical protein [Staphylococcus xylosus]